jgi:cyclopropane-fatty-acyl-phospholipid synthase
MSLDDAQRSKYELICQKLGLQPGMRLLDIGCGWGGLLIHAAEHHGVDAVGITLSPAQQERAAKRVAAAGLEHRVEVRVQDYRDVSDGPFDAISSIGMVEHVGLSQLDEYFRRALGLLKPQGRFLNHGISRPDGEGGFDRGSFVDHYVFPDGELHEVGRVVATMDDLGFEVRDVHSLREHYAKTLRAWVANLLGSWDECVALGGAGRARVWLLYMAASALNFEAGRTSIHQVLAVRSDGGVSGVPLTRETWT